MHSAAQYGSFQCLRLFTGIGDETEMKDDLYNSTALGWAKHEGMEPLASAYFLNMGEWTSNERTR